MCATLRLGRRATELVSMTLEEVRDAKCETVREKRFYIIKVKEQKNLKCGKMAPIAFNEEEYSALESYISVLRPKLNLNKNCKTVFSTVFKTENRSLSLPGLFKILQSYETESGKKISTRAVRGSKVTNSRQHSYSQQQIADRASAMSHTIPTQDRYYNYRELTDSVASTLAQDLELHESASGPSTSTPAKQTGEAPHFSSSSSSSSVTGADETVMTLRTKKIKRSFKN